MKVYFSPEYSGFCYTGLMQKQGHVDFDVEVDGVSGLFGLLELFAGYHWKPQDSSTRTIEYYRAMMEYMSQHPDDILGKSFEIDGLSTASKCLTWRDRLVLAGWSVNSKSAKGRITTLKGIEKYFNCPGDGERIHIILDAIKKGCTLPKDLSVIIPCDISFLHPVLQELLNALQKRGVEVDSLAMPDYNNKTDLDQVRSLLKTGKVESESLKGDGTFQIFSFPSEQDALLRMSLHDMDKFDLWINSSNKAFDNMLYMQGQPTTGSAIGNSFPLLSQTFIIGLGLFQKPMNLQNMLSWLQLPMSPIPWKVRMQFVSAITRSGGYYNEPCRNLRANLIKEDNNLEVIFNTFMPSMETPADVLNEKNIVNVGQLRDFTKALDSWLNQQIAILQSKGRQLESEQLSVASSQADAIAFLLEDKHIGTEIPYNKLQGWMGSLYEPSSFVQYDAQVGCRNVIDSPGKIIAQCQSAVWYGFNGSAPISPTYSFLSPREKKEMPDLHLWDEDSERQYIQSMRVLPFLMTSGNMVLVTYDNINKEQTSKDPILIQLESTFKNINKEPITITPDVPCELIQNVDKVNNQLEDKVGFKINNGDKLQWADCESATSLEGLIQNPMDYVINNLLGIDGAGPADMQAVYMTEGNVAHAVIAELFDKDDEIKGSGTYQYIKEQVSKEFEETFNRILVSKGALLLQSENRIEAKILKDQLRRCINNLLGIMRVNRLHVEACEKGIESNNMEFAHNIKIKGYLDMRLADDNDGQYIFDFKWTTSDRHIHSLEENRSIQLALYAELVRKEISSNVVAEAYFLMPRGKLYSTYPFEANDNFEKVELSENAPSDDTIDMVRNSYNYRRNQITNGNIEMGEGIAVEFLPYEEDREENHLLPLAVDNSFNKRINYYSNNQFFKK